MRVTEENQRQSLRYRKYSLMTRKPTMQRKSLSITATINHLFQVLKNQALEK